MQIIKYSVGHLQSNCYLLIDKDNCLIIDPGDEAGFILEELRRKKINLVGLLATHGHFDHIGVAGEIQLSINIPLYIFKEDQFLIDRLNETAKHFLGYDPKFISPITVKYLTEKKFRISNFEFRIIACPGHTPGSCSFYFPKENVVFSGDTLFKQGIGRYDFSYCSKKNLKNSLKELLKLPKTTVVYPGHGEETTIANEQNMLQLII